MDPAKKRKAFGQHFLVDTKVISAISTRTLELMEARACDSLLEIGPGQGAITLPLIESLGERAKTAFRVIEKDRYLADIWTAKGIATTRADFLDLNGTSWMAEGAFGVVSNLPYSAGTAIFTRMAEHPDRVQFMVLMFQAEVARRLRAHPGERAFGSLSLWTQNHWEVSLLVQAPPRAFRPPPKVNSEVIVLTPRTEPLIKGSDTLEGAKAWQNLLKICFLHKRKMLRSSLPDGPYQNALAASGVDGTKRAEALEWSEWKRLFDSLGA